MAQLWFLGTILTGILITAKKNCNPNPLLLHDWHVIVSINHSFALRPTQRPSALDKNSFPMVISPIFARRNLISDSLSGARPLLDADTSAASSSNCFFYFIIRLAFILYMLGYLTKSFITLITTITIFTLKSDTCYSSLTQKIHY